MTVTIELPEPLGSLLEAQAAQHGDSISEYARFVLERALASDAAAADSRGGPATVHPLKTGRGMLAKYGPAPSAEEIDSNRAEMFGRFAEDF